MPVLDNPRHERFAQGLAEGKTADEAYEAAGFRPHRGNASRLSANESVRRRVVELQAVAAERSGVTVERTLTELARIGFADIRKAVQWRSNATVIGEDPDTGEPAFRAFNEVQLVDSASIDNDTAAAISEISQTDKGALKLKMHDKLGALRTIAQHLGMLKERVEHTGRDGGPIQTESISETELARRLAFVLARGAAAGD